MKTLLIVITIILSTFTINGQIVVGVSSNYVNDFVYSTGNEKYGYGVHLGYELFDVRHALEFSYIFTRSEDRTIAPKITFQQKMLKLQYSYMFLSKERINQQTGKYWSKSDDL